VAKEKLEDADVVIKPPVSNYKMLDFRDAEGIIASGYKETRAHYADICRLTDREKPEKHALDEFWEFVFGID
jgi:predicted acylesterase/phospholipase RssA